MQQHLNIIKERFPKDKYARSLGVMLDSLTDDAIVMHMELRDDMVNMYDRPHGAIIYALADIAFSVLGNNKNNVSVGLDCSITYHASPDPGSTLVVKGDNISQSKRTAAFLLSVYMEKEGVQTLIATMKSVSYRTGRPIDPTVKQ